MIPPVRCFTCNKPLSAIWYNLQETPSNERHTKLMQLTTRYCCRALIMTSDDLTPVIANAHFITNSETHIMEFETTLNNPRTITTQQHHFVQYCFWLHGQTSNVVKKQNHKLSNQSSNIPFLRKRCEQKCPPIKICILLDWGGRCVQDGWGTTC